MRTRRSGRWCLASCWSSAPSFRPATSHRSPATLVGAQRTRGRSTWPSATGYLGTAFLSLPIQRQYLLAEPNVKGVVLVEPRGQASQDRVFLVSPHVGDDLPEPDLCLLSSEAVSNPHDLVAVVTLGLLPLFREASSNERRHRP